MKQNFNLNTTTQNLKSTLGKLSKYHYFISIALMIIGVAFTAFSINNILNNPVTTDTSAHPGFSKNFDTATIQKIKQFKYSDQAPPAPGKPPFRMTRTNPFSESLDNNTY
jgi:hypothetical protein